MGARSCLYSSIPHVKSKKGRQLAGDKEGWPPHCLQPFSEGAGAGGSQLANSGPLLLGCSCCYGRCLGIFLHRTLVFSDLTEVCGLAMGCEPQRCSWLGEPGHRMGWALAPVGSVALIALPFNVQALQPETPALPRTCCVSLGNSLNSLETPLLI